MEIIEKTVRGKSNSTDPEDGIAINDNFIAVIDGSTSKTARRHSKEMSNGRFCMILIGKFLDDAPADIDFDTFRKRLTGYVRRHYAPADLERLRERPEERLTASCVVFSRARREIWMIGDCQALVDGRLFDNPKPCEQALAEERAAVIGRLIRSGSLSVGELTAGDPGREAIIPQMIASMKRQNIDYSVVDGFDIPAAHTKTIRLDMNRHTVVLATDGYPFLEDTLAKSELALERQRIADPLNIGTFKATKAFKADSNSFDDRAYIRFIAEAAD